MANPYLLVLLVYALFLMAAGIALSLRVRHSADFFVADRKLGPGLLFATLLAANIGAGSTVGAAGLGYQIGLAGWWWVGSAGIGSLILAFTVGPRIRELAERYNFFTVGDFLERRYGPSVRALVALLLWAGTLSILAGQLIAVAWILEVIAGTSKALGCLLGGIVVIIYFSTGGLKGTAWINSLQLIVKLSGFLLALPLGLAAAGGWEAVRQRLLEQSGHGQAYFSWTGIGIEGVLGYLFLLAPSFIVSPGLLQKIYGARSAQAVRAGVGFQGAILLLYSFFPVLLGVTAASLFPELENPELALPLVMTKLLPFWLGAWLLAAVFSAEVSSADAALFMLATSVSKDLYKTFWNPSADEKQLFRVSRWVSVFSGALGVGLAILLPSVIDALKLFYSLLSVALFVPLVLGLYAAFPRTRACLAAIVISVASTWVIEIITHGQGYWILSPTATGILISLAIVVLSRVFSKASRRFSL